MVPSKSPAASPARFPPKSPGAAVKPAFSSAKEAQRRADEETKRKIRAWKAKQEAEKVWRRRFANTVEPGC